MNAYYQNEHISKIRSEQSLGVITAGDRLISLICAIVSFLTNAVTVKISKAILCTIGFVCFFGIVGSMECESIGILPGILLCFAVTGLECLLFKSMMKKKN